jgi:hypothetical protein
METPRSALVAENCALALTTIMSCIPGKDPEDVGYRAVLELP